MSEIRREHLAKEAGYLLSNDVLLHALAELRAEALEDLALSVDAADTTTVIRGQQTVRVIDSFLARLQGYILDRPAEE
jgi:hypothetical protein